MFCIIRETFANLNQRTATEVAEFVILALKNMKMKEVKMICTQHPWQSFLKQIKIIFCFKLPNHFILLPMFIILNFRAPGTVMRVFYNNLANLVYAINFMNCDENPVFYFI